MRRLICDIVDLGFIIADATPAEPMKRCFSPKETTEGVSRLDSSFKRTSIPPFFIDAITLFSFPMSSPTMDMVANWMNDWKWR